MRDVQRNPPIASRWLRRGEQGAIAALLVLAWGVMGLHAWWQGGTRGRLIEIDEAPPRPAQYLVDINTAGVAELQVLPEIGPSLAERIVTERETGGPYRDLNDLRRVRGIGPRTLERIRPYLRPMPEVGSVAGDR